MRTRILLLVGLAGAIGLWLWSRSRSGQDATQSAAEFIDVSASRISNAVSSHGYRNNNPGNLRANGFNGQQGVDANGLARFDTPVNGTRALGRQLKVYAQRGLTTVRDIIGTWAPPSENDTVAYIADVANQLGVDADAPLNVPARVVELARAIAAHENGYLDSTYDWNWAALP